MRRESRHIGEWIDAPADAVYAYASDPANLPEWAPGLAGAVEREGDDWAVEGPMGRFRFSFVPGNELGVLDHVVALPTGEVFYNPLRVIPDGDTCEIVFTLRRQEGMTDAEFERDSAAVAADLATLKSLLE